MLDPAAPATADPLLTDLTEPQRQAVAHVQGPLLVLAGAGSGKTRVITRRIAHLVLRVGIAPWNVLAITFTNKAAGEMRERVATLVSARQARAITVCTFHSLCARIIRDYAERLNLPRGYTIYDTSDQERAVKQALEALQVSTTNFPPAKVLAAISNAKNDLLDDQAYAKEAVDYFSKNIARIYTRYQAILKQNNALDFDDLLMKTVQLLKTCPDVLAALQDRYQYILIDEYQDTNHAQFMIAHALAARHQNICATGDPDQSIYGWRGANIRNILDFESHFPNAQVVALEQNYRSTKNILAVADKLIQNNKHRKHKGLWTDNETGEPIRVVTCPDERQEAAWIVQQFRDFQEQKNLAWGQMAVFYRINSLSRVIEDALRQAGIPYQIARGTAFYERQETKDAVAYLRLVVNPADEVSLLRVINKPARGISDATVKLLQAQAVGLSLPLVEALQHPQALTVLNNRASAAVQKFAQQLAGWRAQAGFPVAAPLPTPGAADPSLRGFVEMLLQESGLQQLFKNDKSDPDQERLANLGELVSSAQQFDEDYTAQFNEDPQALTLRRKIEAYLQQISLVSDVDGLNTEQGSVTLMTLHAAKGLEFPVVAILGVEDGLLPHDRANHDPMQLEEERRLCFVGITRAKRFLSLSHARYRTVFGKTTPTIPSRFLTEMPPQCLEFIETDGADSTLDHAPVEEHAASRPQAEFAPGMLVRHPNFGLGRIMSLSALGSGTRVQVRFNSGGMKNLILEYAHLERADPA